MHHRGRRRRKFTVVSAEHCLAVVACGVDRERRRRILTGVARYEHYEVAVSAVVKPFLVDKPVLGLEEQECMTFEGNRFTLTDRLLSKTL